MKTDDFRLNSSSVVMRLGPKVLGKVFDDSHVVTRTEMADLINRVGGVGVGVGAAPVSPPKHPHLPASQQSMRLD